MAFASQPDLVQFRIEPARDGLAHLVFDMPDRSMNVFSNAAIHELGRFSTWLRTSDVRGVVVRSGKASAFCAGADLGELGTAYDMIMAARPEARHKVAFDHFFPLSQAIRGLETSGKPVAVAIAGLALGGGCELALGGHYRVLAHGPDAALGLPESLVGLLPGAGGTQRLPRLIGMDAALPILLRGGRLSGLDALEAGLVDQVVEAGSEVAAAEAWLLSPDAVSIQPWDRPDGVLASREDVAHRIVVAREQVLGETLGHEPAPLAILDCIEQGLPLPFDQAIRTEMDIFSHLIQRAEARDMIRTLFHGKADYERAKRKDAVPDAVADAIVDLLAHIEIAEAKAPLAMAGAGFRKTGFTAGHVQTAVTEGYWLDGDDSDPRRQQTREALEPLVSAARHIAAGLPEVERRMIDYAVVSQGGFPAYLGGPIAFALSRPPA